MQCKHQASASFPSAHWGRCVEDRASGGKVKVVHGHNDGQDRRSETSKLSRHGGIPPFRLHRFAPKRDSPNAARKQNERQSAQSGNPSFLPPNERAPPFHRRKELLPAAEQISFALQTECVFPSAAGRSYFLLRMEESLVLPQKVGVPRFRGRKRSFLHASASYADGKGRKELGIGVSVAGYGNRNRAVDYRFSWIARF